MFVAGKLVILAYIGAVELSVPVTFPSVAVMFEDIGFVVEPISPSGVVGVGLLLRM